MPSSKNSKKGKGLYATYKTENRAYKNKVAKLEKHLRTYPNDEEAKKALEKLRDPKKFNVRTKPDVPGSNQPEPHSEFNPIPGYLHYPRSTPAGEQLSKLLGIPLVKTTRRKGKAPVTYKKKRNVKKS